MLRLPVVHGILLGSEERYGWIDESGNFHEIEDPRSAKPQLLSPLTHRIALELPCTADMLDPSGETIAVLSFSTFERRVVCTSISALPGKELTGQILRQVPIAFLTKEATKGRLVHMRDGFAVRFVQNRGSLDLEEAPRRRTLSNEFLSRVADVYRDALASGLSTQQEIQRQLGPISDAGARRWVMQARKSGFLGQAIGAWRAGEDHSTSS